MPNRNLTSLVALGSALALSFALLGGTAGADPASDLSEAEARAASAEADVTAARQQLDAARAAYAATSKRASQPARESRAAQAEVRDMRTELVERQRDARAEIAALEATADEEAEEHDEEVAASVGIALAALVVAALALAWGWFRSSPPVGALLRMGLAQAVALCVGGSFLLVAIGAALFGDGVLGALGMMILCLGLALPVLLLLGRHSAAVQSGRAKPLTGRDRLPGGVARSVAALFLLIFVTGLGLALFSEEPDATVPSAQVREEAEALTGGPGATQLAAAESEAAALRRRAAGPLAKRRAAGAAVRAAGRTLRDAESELTRAKASENSAERRLAAATRQEEREAEAQAEREREQAEEEEEEEVAPESSGCDENYSGCVPPYPPDVDCAEVGGSVTVLGSDPHGLDADSDGVGCE